MTIKPAVDQAAELAWFKSSYSTNEGPDCVEVAAAPAAVHVRDSKDVQGPQLVLSAAAWTGFITYATDRVSPTS